MDDFCEDLDVSMVGEFCGTLFLVHGPKPRGEAGHQDWAALEEILGLSKDEPLVIITPGLKTDMPGHHHHSRSSSSKASSHHHSRSKDGYANGFKALPLKVIITLGLHPKLY
ncbi:hypothetical protein Ancab_002594 [Ancistrocladus abbreviatus]